MDGSRSPPWKVFWERGMELVRLSKYVDSLAQFDKAASRKSDEHVIYESRSMVLEKLGRYEEALRDSRRVVELAPASYVGYARSSQILFKTRKLHTSLKMATLALKRINERDQEQRDEILHLRTQILDSLKKAEARKASHFGKLPIEIASEIFILAMGDSVFGAFAMSHVCRAWRGIALNIPALWRSVVIKHNRDIPKAGVILKRANGNVKRLEIHPDSGPYQKNFLKRHAHHSFWDRLETLALICDADLGVFRNLRFEFTLWELIPWKRLQLKTFILSSVYYSWPAGRFWAAINRMTHRTFSNVTFKGPVVPSSHLEQYSSLTRLQIDYSTGQYSQQELASLFYYMPRLETAVIDIMVPTSTEIQRPPNNAPFAMASLLHLEIHRGGGWLANFLKGEFSFPALQTLHVYERFALGDYLFRLEPLAANLVALRLCTWNIPAAVLISFLKAAPNIVTLDLFKFGRDLSDEMDALGGDNQPPICLKLEHIHFRYCNMLSCSSLVNLVHGRFAHTKIADALDASLADATAMERRRSALDRIFAGAGTAVIPIKSLVIERCDLIHPEMIQCLRTPVTHIRYTPSFRFTTKRTQVPKRRVWK